MLSNNAFYLGTRKGSLTCQNIAGKEENSSLIIIFALMFMKKGLPEEVNGALALLVMCSEKGVREKPNL